MSRPSFRSGPISKNEKSGDSGKRQKTIRQVNPNNPQQKKLLRFYCIIYPSRPSFRSGPISKNEKSGDLGKRQKTIRQVSPNNPQQKKLLQTQVASYYDLPSTQRRINTLIPKITQVTQVFVFAYRSRTKTWATQVNFKKCPILNNKGYLCLLCPRKVEIILSDMVFAMKIFARVARVAQAARVSDLAL